MQTTLKHLPPIEQLPVHSSDDLPLTAKVIGIESTVGLKAKNCRREKLIAFITCSMDVEKIYLPGTFPCFTDAADEEYYLLVLISEQEHRDIVQLENIVNNLDHGIAPVFASIFRISSVNEMIATGNKFFINACTADKLIYEKREVPTPFAA